MVISIFFRPEKSDGSIVFPEGKKNIVTGQDLNEISDGVWISTSGTIGDSCVHKPNEQVYNFILFQWTTSSGNSVQILFSGTGAIYNRRSTGGTWNANWYKQSFTNIF